MEQIITGEGDIVANLDDHIKNIGIWDIGADYRMIAIIGCQSSGKSTLLNLLFGTTFATMNDKIGRQQTTKGVHAAKSDSHIFITSTSERANANKADFLSKSASESPLSRESDPSTSKTRILLSVALAA